MHTLRSWIHGSALVLGVLTLAWLHQGAIYGLSLGAFLTSLWVMVSSRPLARTHGVAPAGSLALGALCLGPLAFCAALAIVSEPFALEVAPQAERGFGDLLVLGGLFGVALPAVLWRAGGNLGFTLWPRLVARGPHLAMRASSLLVTLTALLVVLAAARALERPAFTAPFAAAAHVARLYPLGEARTASGTHVHRFEGISLRARCDQGRCAFLARPPGDAPFAAPRGRELAGAPSFASGAPVTVYRWPVSSLWVVVGSDGTRAAFHPLTSPLPVPVTAAEVAPYLSVPASWIALAAAGVVLGAWLLARARRARLAADFGGWCDAVMQDGAVTLAEDQRTFPMAPGLRPPAGDVVVRRAALAAVGGGYRADPTLTPEDVRAGTVADLARAADAEAIRALAVASLPPALTIAPLLAARLVGLW